MKTIKCKKLKAIVLLVGFMKYFDSMRRNNPSNVLEELRVDNKLASRQKHFEQKNPK